MDLRSALRKSCVYLIREDMQAFQLASQVGFGWFLDGFGRFWSVLVSFDRFRLVLDRFLLVLLGFGRFWLVLVGFAWFWWVLAGFGRFQ